MKVKLSEITDAIEMAEETSKYYLDKKTGEIVWISELAMDTDEMERMYDELDEHGFFRLPDTYDIHAYSIMEDFVDSLPGPMRDRLARAISGKGAFRRFKDGIRQLGIEEQWYEYQSRAYVRIAIEWCEQNGIEYE